MPARAARRSVRRSTSARPAVARGGEADHWQGTPVTVYVVAHPHCAESRALADGLFCWLRLQGGEEAAQDAGLPVWFRSQIVDEGAGPRLSPPIAWSDARLNVVVVLCSDPMVVDPGWWAALSALLIEVDGLPAPTVKSVGAALVLPVGVSEAVGRLGFLVAQRQVIRLPRVGEGRDRAPSAPRAMGGAGATARLRALRRAVMEATLRHLPASRGLGAPKVPVAGGAAGGAAFGVVPEARVFLSHAKADGRVIAERLRDGLADFSQLRPWFDANDLPAGASWAGRMDEAARAATDGLIAVITDAYHTRYWCQREAHHAREPRRLEVGLPLWGVQPTVALLSTAGGAQRVVPALSGVLHIGWRGPDAIAEAAAKTSAVATLSVREAEADAAAETIEDVVEWWLLEALLARVAERRARDVWEAEGPAHDGLALLTFTPDPYTLGRLLGAWRRAQKGQLPKHIGYPGFGLPVAGRERLIEVLLDHGYSDTAARACLVPLLEMVGPAALAAPSPASTPRGGRAGAQGAVAQRPPAGLRVALSAGGTEAELAEVGLGAVHIDDLQVRVSRALLAAGHRLAFGGTFDPGPAAVAGAPRAGGVNLTARLLQLAQGWAAAQADADVHAADAKRGPATGLLDRLKEPPLLNYARWTAAGAPDTAARAARAGACMFIDVLPAGRSAAELAAWVAERAARAAPLPAGASVEQVAEHREARAAVEGKILWAEREALTAMRRRSAQDCGARVLMGGKIHGAAGWLPGVAEELEVSLWAHDPNGAGDPAAWSPAFAQPVLLLGGFGGVSGLLAGFLREADAAWPALPAGSGGAGGADTFEAERCGRWERLEALMRGFRAHLHGLEGGEAVFPADPWTHTTLTKTTFLKLLKVDSPTAALRLVRRVFGA